MPSRVTRILHVSEAYGGGLAAAIREYVKQSPGFEHHLAYVARPEAVVPSSDMSLFQTATVLTGGHYRRFSDLSTLVNRGRFDIIHAHSAFGGVYARLLRGELRRNVVYTPHCYAFLRTDFSRAHRAIFWLVEAVLARRTAVVGGCSPFEVELARRLYGRGLAEYIPNVCTMDAITDSGTIDSPISLLGVGRLTEQKDPHFFTMACVALRAAGIPVTARWAGDGDAAMRDELERSGVQVLGWLPRDEVRRLYAEPGTIYLHGAKWEGFPMGILEAAAAGAPIVVRQSRIYSGLELPWQVASSGDVVAAVMRLATAEQRSRNNLDWRVALAGNSAEAQSDALSRVYEIARTCSVSRGGIDVISS